MRRWKAKGSARRSWLMAMAGRNISTTKIPAQVRMYFSTRTDMLAIAGNFSKDRRFQRTDWLCRCGHREEQEHLLRHCPLYDDIRSKYDELDSDESLVPFFQEVLDKRDKLYEKEKKDMEKKE